MKSDLPAGTVTNEGTVQEDGTVKTFNFKKGTPLPDDVAQAATVVAEERSFEIVKDDGINRCVVQKAPEVQKVSWSPEQLSLIKAKVAPNCTNTEFELLMYMAQRYNLDPLLRQIWAVKFGDSPAQIYAGRDGFLEIAHRSGHFNGMKSWCEYDENQKPLKGKCIVWRNDMEHPFETEVLFKEYSTGKNLWVSKPSVMIVKVAESMCLRKAFSVSGIYSPEEVPN